MNRPDLIIIGFGNSVLTVDALESLRLIPPFKRVPDHILFFKDMARFFDVSAMAVTLDDPDYSSDELYVLFLTTPTERQYEHVNASVIDIEKRITAWFHGTLYLVDHSQYYTLCSIRKNLKGENDEVVEANMVVDSSIFDLLETRDTEIESGKYELHLSGESTGEDDIDHSHPIGDD